MYEEITQKGHSYNHGSVKYYSPNELTRICKRYPDAYYMEEYTRCKQNERDTPRQYRTHYQHENNTNEIDYELTNSKRREKRKNKKEHPEEVPVFEHFRSVTPQYKEKRKHKKRNKHAHGGFSGLNHEDIQRLMIDCNEGINNEPSNFNIGYYEINKNLGGESVDLIPTRHVSSEEKHLKITEDYKQRCYSSEMKQNKQIMGQKYKTPLKHTHTSEEGFRMSNTQLDGENHQHKTRKNREKSKREKEFRTTDSFDVDRMIRPSIFHEYSYPEFSIKNKILQQNGQNRELNGQSIRNLEKNEFHNKQKYSQHVEKSPPEEERPSNLNSPRDDGEMDLSAEYDRKKSKIKKMENEESNNYKLTKKNFKKIMNEREGKDFRPITRKIEHEINKSEQNSKNGNYFTNTLEKYSDHKRNEQREKKRCKKDQHKPIDLDNERKDDSKIQNRKKEYRKYKSRKESRSKAENVSQSHDRAAKDREIIEDFLKNAKIHGILNHNLTLSHAKYKSESSLSTLHKNHDDFICIFNKDGSGEQTATFIPNKKFCDVLPSCRIGTENAMTIHSDNREEFTPHNHVDQMVFPALSDDFSMQHRVELFQTAMKKDLSVRPRSNYSLCRQMPSENQTKLNKNKNVKDVTIKDNLNNIENQFDGTITNKPNEDCDKLLSDIDRKQNIKKAKGSVIPKSRHNSRKELDETEKTYGIIVKGIEPSKKVDKFKTKKNDFFMEKRCKNLECKILSVVAITPDNSDNKMNDHDTRLMRTMSSGLLHKDIALHARNPSTDKRLERLLKYYRVEQHPEMEKFSNCSGRSSKDRKILKKLIISKLADYLKKLDDDNTGEMIEFRTENPRVVKLVLPIDCLSLECSYDINFSMEEIVNESAKESLSDLYINYSDVDEVTSDEQAKFIFSKTQIDVINDKNCGNEIFFGDRVENANHSNNCSDFLSSPTNFSSSIPNRNEMLVNKKKFETSSIKNEDLKLISQNLALNTSVGYQCNSNKEYSGVQCLDLKNSSTFIVSENDRSSAYINCLSNFQTSPRDTIYIKSLQMSDIFNKQKELMDFMENKPINSGDFSQKALSSQRKEETCQIPNTKIETLITVRSVPESRKFSDHIHSQRTPVERGHFNKDDSIPPVLECSRESNNCCRVKYEVHENSKRSTEFLSHPNSNALDSSGQIIKKSDHMNWINKSIPKSVFTATTQDISSGNQASQNLIQSYDNYTLKNDKCIQGKTFLHTRNNCCRTFSKIINEKNFTDDIHSNTIDDIDSTKRNHDEDKYEHCTNSVLLTEPTTLPNDESKVLLLRHFIQRTQDNNDTNNSLKNQIDKKKEFGEMGPETNKHNNSLEEKHNIENKAVNVDNQISSEKEMIDRLEKCLNWDIGEPSKAVMIEPADSDQNKVSGLNKGTQKSTHIPKRSYIPVVKKGVSKCSSVQMRSSSVGRDNNTTLLLTKSYRIPLGQSSYERRKLYDTSIRKNGKRRSLSESSGTTNKNPLIYEVRYFNIHNQGLPPSLINQSYKTEEDNEEIGKGCSASFKKDDNQETNCVSSFTTPFKDCKFNLNTVKTVGVDDLNPYKNNLQNNQSVINCIENDTTYPMPLRDISVTYLHEFRKRKKATHKKNSYQNLVKEKIYNHRHMISVISSENVHARKKKANQKRRNLEASNLSKENDNLTTYIDDSQNCQKLTKLPIEKVNDDELGLFFGNQNFLLTKTRFSENFDGKSSVSSWVDGNICDNRDSIDDNGVSSESTLVNQVSSRSITTESKETVKAIGTREIIEHSIIDSGYLTKEAEVNYSRTTLDGGKKIDGSKLCELFKSKTSRWCQKDILRLKLQLLFPNVYDDFELIEAAEHTELIKFYLESASDKLLGAVEAISHRKAMNIKSRSVISLPSAKTLPKENEPFKSIGDNSSDLFFKMNKGGFYNYQKFIAQNNCQYSSDILSKLKCGDDFKDGRETPGDEYPRSDTSSMKSSLDSIKTTSSARKSIIELFKLKSCKNIISSSEVIVKQADANERGCNENLSEEQFSNHFHQIMALECQKYARKVKNETFLKEHTDQIEEFKEMSLDSILKNRNNLSKNRIDSESLPSLLEADDLHNDKMNEFSLPIHDNSYGSKPVSNIKIIEAAENAKHIVQKNLRSGNLLKNEPNLNFNSHPGENIPPSEFSEKSNFSNVFVNSSNMSQNTPVSDIVPYGNSSKPPEKEFFNNLLNFYDHETEFATKLLRDNEFFVSLLEKIREDDSLNVMYQKNVQKKFKKEKKLGILGRLFGRKKKSNETLFTTSSIGKSLEFANSLSADNNSVNKESCYSFFRDIEDFEKGTESEPRNQAATEILKKLAYKAKSHLEPMAKATFSNQRINDRIKLTGFLSFLDMIERGDIACISNISNNKSIVEEKLREHVAVLFDKVYRIANREVVQRNKILDDKKIDLLKFLVTKYHMGMDVHINILAIYIGRNLIQSRSQLEGRQHSE